MRTKENNDDERVSCVIEYVDWGVARSFPDGLIQLNKRLREHPYWHDLVMSHELKHVLMRSNGGDLRLEMSEKPGWGLALIMLRNPRMLVQLLPCYIANGRLGCDKFVLLCWGVVVFVWGLAVLQLIG